MPRDGKVTVTNTQGSAGDKGVVQNKNSKKKKVVSDDESEDGPSGIAKGEDGDQLPAPFCYCEDEKGENVFRAVRRLTKKRYLKDGKPNPNYGRDFWGCRKFGGCSFFGFCDGRESLYDSSQYVGLDELDIKKRIEMEKNAFVSMEAKLDYIVELLKGDIESSRKRLREEEDDEPEEIITPKKRMYKKK